MGMSESERERYRKCVYKHAQSAHFTLRVCVCVYVCNIHVCGELASHKISCNPPCKYPSSPGWASKNVDFVCQLLVCEAVSSFSLSTFTIS